MERGGAAALAAIARLVVDQLWARRAPRRQSQQADEPRLAARLAPVVLALRAPIHDRDDT